MNYQYTHAEQQSGRSPAMATDLSESLGRPSATSEEYTARSKAKAKANISASASAAHADHSVSIHNIIEMQSWEKRQGISNSFDPARKWYSFHREHSNSNNNSNSNYTYSHPTSDRERSRSRSRSQPKRRSDYDNQSPRADEEGMFPNNGHQGTPNHHNYSKRIKHDNHQASPSYRGGSCYNHPHSRDRRDRHSPGREGHYLPSFTDRSYDRARAHPGDNHSASTHHQDGWETSRSHRRQQRYRPHNNHAHGGSAKNTGDPAPPQVAYISPTKANQAFKPFVLLLCGIPGSGKSTFASCLVQGKPWMYVRINQDTLGNRLACEVLTRSTLEEGKCPIIDRCNFDPKQRKHFLMIARELGVDVDGVIFQYPMATCVARCQSRQHHETITPQNANGIVQEMVRRFSPPLPNRINAESFRALSTVADVSSFNDVMMEYLNNTFE